MLKFSSKVIKAAASSTRGVLSLICLIVGSLALAFFSDAPTSAKLFVFTLSLLGAVGFGWGMFNQNQIAKTSPQPIDAKTFVFCGRWSLRISGPHGDDAAYIDYHNNGRFEGFQEFFIGDQGRRQPVSGRWIYTPLSTEEFNITFAYDNGPTDEVRFSILDSGRILNVRMNCVVYRIRV